VRSALTKVPLLSSLTEKQLQKICDSVEIVPYKTGDVIIKKGDVGDIFFMIKSGRVAVTEVNASNEVTYGPGDHFGERALLTGNGSPAVTPLSPQFFVNSCTHSRKFHPRVF